ncbi:MAG TPA: phage tail sheath C-terminal domain-containing protein [Xanthobacteraceae bacterium]|nr:phage tail sheath C-terminal domain-containing protein [Xanthobacteraceae bacterium]
MQLLKTPGVYVQEVATLPPSVAEVSTAVPAFIGRTERGTEAARITSFLEYQTRFGTVPRSPYRVTVGPAADGQAPPLTLARGTENVPTTLYYYLSHYFTNGGGPCWIVPVSGNGTPKEQFLAGLARLEQEDEPTLILFPEAADTLALADYGELAQAALAQCNRLKDRFTVLDVPGGQVAAFRNAVGTQYLSYGAAYYPYLNTTINWLTDDDSVTVQRDAAGNAASFARILPDEGGGIVAGFTGDPGARPRIRIDAGEAAADPSFTVEGTTLRIGNGVGKTGTVLAAAWATWIAANPPSGFSLAADGAGTAIPGATAAQGLLLAVQQGAAVSLASLKTSETALYNRIKDALTRERVTLPPSAAVVGLYAAVDRDRGVWKAPANVGVSGVIGLVSRMTDADQEDLNIDPTAGKSINALREFTGRGTLVWGARTLAGNDNEWRYVPVRRLFITIEESTRKASAFAVFEPNDATTWLKVKGMIESYLYALWERGALAGSKPESAYYVNIGLGRTMTAQDVLEGRLIVEIGIAAVRPAEFIVLRFMHRLQQA